MDDKTEAILLQLAHQHPIAVLVVMSLPGGTTFLMAFSQLIKQVLAMIAAIKGKHPDAD